MFKVLVGSNFIRPGGRKIVEKKGKGEREKKKRTRLRRVGGIKKVTDEKEKS